MLSSKVRAEQAVAEQRGQLQLEFQFKDTGTLTSILSLRERRTTQSPGEGKSNGSQLVRDVYREGATRSPLRVDKILAAPPPNLTSVRAGLAFSERPIHLIGRDPALESKARELLVANGAARIADELRVEWNPRLQSCAGRADYREKLISLNPQLRNLGNRCSDKLDCLKQSSLTSAADAVWEQAERRALVRDEIDRTLRHELAHLLAQFRAGRRRILPHGAEWRAACIDLGIGDEKRCHNLPFPFIERTRRLLYKCPHCKRDFPRVRKIRRAIACLACCRKHNGGEFDARFRLLLCSGGL
jgi:predicted SprT family Zn-dependent metalloprotease